MPTPFSADSASGTSPATGKRQLASRLVLNKAIVSKEHDHGSNRKGDSQIPGHQTTHQAQGLGCIEGTPQNRSYHPSPETFRRRSQAGREVHRGSFGHLSGLFEEPHHRQNFEALARSGEGIGFARTDRRNVSRRKNKHYGESRRPSCGPARS